MRVNPESKVHGARMGSIRGRQDPGGPHVGPINLAIKEVIIAQWHEFRDPVSFPGILFDLGTTSLVCESVDVISYNVRTAQHYVMQFVKNKFRRKHDYGIINIQYQVNIFSCYFV